MTLALLPGSFDPVTHGHLQVVRQAALLFSHVRVVVAVHPTKAPWFSLDERVALFADAVAHMPQVSVDGTTALIPDYAREVGARVVVRGVRGAADAEAEQRLACLYREANPALSVVLLPADNVVKEVSSTELKATMMRGDDVTGLCPPHVAAALAARWAKRQLQREEGAHVDAQ